MYKETDKPTPYHIQDPLHLTVGLSDRHDVRPRRPQRRSKDQSLSSDGRGKKVREKHSHGKKPLGLLARFSV